MVVHFFGGKSDPRHEAERSTEIGKHEGLGNGVAIARVLPSGEGCERRAARLGAELGGHAVFPVITSLSYHTKRVLGERGAGCEPLRPRSCSGDGADRGLFPDNISAAIGG